MAANFMSFTPYEVKSSVIHITGYENRNPVGFIENPLYPQNRYFANLTQFLIIMDDLCDEIYYPQGVNEGRSFLKRDLSMGIESVRREWDEFEKDIAAFRLSIFFCQNSSWQGTITWLETQVQEQFRSALELTMLMDSVLVSKILDKPS